MLNARAIAQKWQRNISNSTESIRQGVNEVTVSPTEKAALRADAYVSGVQNAVNNGKWQAGLRRVTVADWKDAMLKKGVPRIGTGATEALPKVEAFLSEFIPHLEAGVRMLESMPRGTIEQNIQRAVEMMQHNAKFRRRG